VCAIPDVHAHTDTIFITYNSFLIFSFGCLLPLSLCSNHTPASLAVFIKRGLFNVAFFLFNYDIFSLRAF
jgi:hypothetical protein